MYRASERARKRDRALRKQNKTTPVNRRTQLEACRGREPLHRASTSPAAPRRTLGPRRGAVPVTLAGRGAGPVPRARDPARSGGPPPVPALDIHAPGHAGEFTGNTTP